MVQIQIADEEVTFNVKGLHKLWALKSAIAIPKEHLVDVRPYDNELDKLSGMRAPGTYIPYLISAGSFITSEGWIFCDYSRKENVITVFLRDEHYKMLIIEVEDPVEAMGALKNAMHLPLRH